MKPSEQQLLNLGRALVSLVMEKQGLETDLAAALDQVAELEDEISRLKGEAQHEEDGYVPRHRLSVDAVVVDQPPRPGERYDGELGPRYTEPLSIPERLASLLVDMGSEANDQMRRIEVARARGAVSRPVHSPPGE